MPITYKELAEKILAMPPERQQDHVTVTRDISEEVSPVDYAIQIGDEDWALGILDKGHLILGIQA